MLTYRFVYRLAGLRRNFYHDITAKNRSGAKRSFTAYARTLSSPVSLVDIIRWD